MKAVILIPLFLGASLLYAQTNYDDRNAEEIAEAFVGLPDDEMTYEAQLELASRLYNQPIDINKATEDDLNLLFMLTPVQVINLMNHIKTNGAILSMYELQAIDGFTPEIIRSIAPFIRFPEPFTERLPQTYSQARRSADTYVIFRTSANFESWSELVNSSDSTYQGNNLKQLVQFRSSQPGNFSMGITLEKDAGEAVAWSSGKYGFDHSSFHVQLKNRGILKNLIIGDFVAQEGQGLVLGGGFGLGKGSESVASVRRSTLGFLPFTSTREYGFYRGVATTICPVDNLYVSGFYSAKKIDGRIESEGSPVITAFIHDGLHRTEKELHTRSNVGEQQFGGSIRFKKGRFETGVLAQHTQFSFPVQPNPTLYNQFAFTGRDHLLAGTFLNITFRNLSFFSEVAKNLGYGSAVVSGVIGSFTNKVDLALLFRNYQKDYNTFTSNAFAEASSPRNEQGMYWGWTYRINRVHRLSGYVDLFRTPWLAYRQYRPAQGHEIFMRFTSQFSKTALVYIQVREEEKQINLSEESTVYLTAPRIRRSLRFHAEYAFNDRVMIRTRAQFSDHLHNAIRTTGMLIHFDLSLRTRVLTLSFRHALFDTEDYENRQYIYEKDAWMAFSLPAFYGTGIRDYAMVSWKVLPGLTFWVRYARTWYKTAFQIPVIDDQNIQNDLKFQLRMTF